MFKWTLRLILYSLMIYFLQTKNIESTKPLPKQRPSEIFELGYKDANHVRPGRVSLLQAIDFINKHQSNPDEWTIEKIAEENKIKPDVASKYHTAFVRNILQSNDRFKQWSLISLLLSIPGDIVNFYRVFDVHLSKDMDRQEVDKIRSNMKLLGASSNKD